LSGITSNRQKITFGRSLPKIRPIKNGPTFAKLDHEETH